MHYNGFRSHEILITSGVLQGSNLGLLLFVLFSNDLWKVWPCGILTYADDIKLFPKIDYAREKCIDYAFAWRLESCLMLNSTKSTSDQLAV